MTSGSLTVPAEGAWLAGDAAETILATRRACGAGESAPGRELRVLLVEDVEDDALLILAALEDSGLRVHSARVDSSAQLRDALQQAPWDVVISDHGLPGWDVFGVLATLDDSGMDVPCIVVSGAIEEPAAIAAMRAGAEDYLSKDDLARLGPALERAVRDAQMRAAACDAQQEVVRSERRLAALFHNAADGVAVLDAQGCLTYCSPSLTRLLGTTDGPSLVVTDAGPELGRLVVPPATFARLLATAGSNARFEATGVYADDEARHFEVVASNALHDPAVNGVIVNVRDVSATYRAQVELRHQAELNRAMLDSLPAEVAVLDDNGCVVATNPAWAGMARQGSSLHPTVGESFLRAVTAVEATCSEPVSGVAAALAAGRRFRADVPLPGGQDWRLLSIDRLTDGQGAVVAYTDISSRKKFEAELARHALRDPLTGLANRVLLQDRLTQALARMRRWGGPVAVVFADVDGFKVVNDSLSHEVGDQLLVAVAGRITALVRAVDTVARFGGDEFVLVMPGIGEEVELDPVLQRIHEAMRAPFEVAGRSVAVSLSMGVTFATTPDADPLALVADADAAMYQAKKQGRARHSVFNEGLRKRALSRLETEADLRTTLERHELTVHYQPLVRLPDRCLAGFEALVRWQHPTRGLVPPAEFIPVAEDSGLIVPLGRQVLQDAWSQLAIWSTERGDPPWRMSVNISARQLVRPEFVAEIHALLNDSPLPAQRLELEITESVLMGDEGSTLTTVNILKELGVRVTIDDFGTGYSSLAYLRKLPVDALKIDRSFVRGIATDSGDAAIATAIIRLADTLGLDVVAEGVETEEQAETLTRLGCGLAQGYLFSHPIPADRMGPLLTARTL